MMNDAYLVGAYAVAALALAGYAGLLALRAKAVAKRLAQLEALYVRRA